MPKIKKGNYIYYGDGDIRIKFNKPISAFDIILVGTYTLESYNPNNFIISYNNGRVLGVGLGSTLGENAFLKYKGDLKIIKCKAVTTDMEIVDIIPRLIRNDRFNSVQNIFNGENLKFENLNKVGVVGVIPYKITVNIITKNLYTKGTEYLLDGVDYIGDYHLHSTGIAMTGSDHTEDSEELEIKNKSKRKKTIQKIIRTRTSQTGVY